VGAGTGEGWIVGDEVGKTVGRLVYCSQPTNAVVDIRVIRIRLIAAFARVLLDIFIW
jgi:hypothetical protein